MLTVDNRNMNDMETWYLAKIEALQRRIEELEATLRNQSEAKKEAA